MKRAVAVLVLAAAMLAPSCGSKPARVLVGIGLATNNHDAIRLAASEINADGGIGGVPLELTGVDDPGIKSSFNPAHVLAWADRMVKTPGLIAVVGHSDSALTISAAPTYNKAGVPQIVTIATNPAITNIGEWTYRLCLSDSAQGPALAEYAVRDWNKRRIAMVFVNDDYGRGLAHLFEQRVVELGARIVDSVMHRNTFQADDKEMVSLAIAGMKTRSRPDLIALFQRIESAQFTLQALRAAGVDTDILGGDNLAQAAMTNLRDDVTAHLRVSQFFHVNPDNARAVQFARKFRSQMGRDPDYSEAFAYDAIYLIRDAALAGGYTRAGVKDYLDGLISDRASINGAGGVFTLAPNHDARRPLYIADIHRQQFRIINTLPVQ